MDSSPSNLRFDVMDAAGELDSASSIGSAFVFFESLAGFALLLFALTAALRLQAPALEFSESGACLHAWLLGCSVQWQKILVGQGLFGMAHPQKVFL